MKRRYLLCILLFAVFRTQAQTIVWDQSTLTVLPTGQARYNGYARMIQRHDKSLLAIYEAGGSVLCMTSRDLGKSWSAPVVIAAREEGINMAVPDILELKDHRLLACYNPRPYRTDTSRRFAIRVKTSSDGGQSWAHEQVLYKAGHEFENGCWEPCAVQLPSGEIQLYFANEGPYTRSNEQEISMLRSTDNAVSWSAAPEKVSFRPGKRDGMPVPLLLKGGKQVVFAIEDNDGANFKPYIIVYGNGTAGADSPQRRYALKEKIADSIYAGAPYIRQLKSGETILSYQGTEGRRNRMESAEMKVVVGDQQARNFTGKTIPFNIPPDKHGLWNSLCVLDDDTIIALTSTNANGRGEIWMIKGRLRK